VTGEGGGLSGGGAECRLGSDMEHVISNFAALGNHYPQPMCEIMTTALPLNFTYADILQILPQLPPPALEQASNARQFWAQQKNQREAIDHRLMADLAAWVAGWRNAFPVRITHPRIMLYAADQAAAGESETADLLTLLTAEEAPLVELAEQADADLRIYELDLQHPQHGPMTEEECAKLIIYGMMTVEPGLDLLTVSGFGQGADDKADGLLQSLAAAADQPLKALAEQGGRDSAAIFGTMLAARMGRVPLIAEGSSALAAAAVLQRLDHRAVQHVLFAGSGHEQAAALGMLTVASGQSGIGLAATSLIETIRNACDPA